MTGEQFRVVWYRRPYGGLIPRTEGRERRVRVFGTKRGAERFRLVLLGRGWEAYGVDPDARFCCSGYDVGTPCPCLGRTNREHYELMHEQRGTPPLVGEPVIESRPVGSWALS